jgi:DHA2 family multidrug resistance protein-like MFS transporter
VTDTTQARAGVREWTGLAVLALPALLASLELTVTHLALPAIAADLAAGSTQLLWIVDIYAFLLAAVLIPVGALGDRIGRRKVLLIGSVGYGAASALAAYAPTPELLIAARCCWVSPAPRSCRRRCRSPRPCSATPTSAPWRSG